MVLPASPDDDANTKVQIVKISSEPKNFCEKNTIETLLQNEPEVVQKASSDTFSTEQLMESKTHHLVSIRSRRH